MKKYKLIKLYPNSPEIGTIVHKTKAEDGYGWKDEGPYDSRLFTNKTVENHPEFWEEVKEPILITKDGKEMYDGDVNYNLFSVLPCDNFREKRTYLEFARLYKNEDTEWLHFHTKEAKDEYIKWNKPMYSLNDLKGLHDKTIGTAYSEVIIEELEKLGRK